MGQGCTLAGGRRAVVIVACWAAAAGQVDTVATARDACSRGCAESAFMVARLAIGGGAVIVLIDSASTIDTAAVASAALADVEGCALEALEFAGLATGHRRIEVACRAHASGCRTVASAGCAHRETCAFSALEWACWM
jgi:hypothetical protein